MNKYHMVPLYCFVASHTTQKGRGSTFTEYVRNCNMVYTRIPEAFDLYVIKCLILFAPF